MWGDAGEMQVLMQCCGEERGAALNRIFFQYQANLGEDGNGTWCLLDSDIHLAKLPKLSPCIP